MGFYVTQIVPHSRLLWGRRVSGVTKSRNSGCPNEKSKSISQSLGQYPRETSAVSENLIIQIN